MFDNANLIKDLIQENAHLRKMIHTFVFCKDCKHWKPYHLMGHLYGECKGTDIDTEPNDFCSRGERKNEDVD